MGGEAQAYPGDVGATTGNKGQTEPQASSLLSLSLYPSGYIHPRLQREIQSKAKVPHCRKPGHFFSLEKFQDCHVRLSSLPAAHSPRGRNNQDVMAGRGDRHRDKKSSRPDPREGDELWIQRHPCRVDALLLKLPLHPHNPGPVKVNSLVLHDPLHLCRVQFPLVILALRVECGAFQSWRGLLRRGPNIRLLIIRLGDEPVRHCPAVAPATTHPANEENG